MAHAPTLEVYTEVVAFLSSVSRSALALLLSAMLFAQSESVPWPKSDVIEPAALAALVQTSKPPLVISVAFPVLYRGRHILHAIDAGAASRPEGLAALRKLVRDVPKNAEVVIYCGCCPMNKCPNIRPAYRALKDMGLKNIRVLDIPVNMHTDWYAKNYPSEAGSEAPSSEK
ncbi:MAG TPA: rhodanese-like domain-containing protein [Bryobacteraceae bacterium]|nr:rhodanese-like domain-containing protein [Bryobacteraceae bacterium]